MQFDEMGLNPKILRAIAREGYETATPIQSEAIGPIMQGRDLLGCAQTGTGKTAAFALPVLHRILPEKVPNHHKNRKNRRRPIAALVLVPTRELATQVHQSFEKYARSTDLRSTVIYGGVSQNPQARALRAGVDVVVATPGRLLDLMGQRLIRLDELQMLILDEADQMLDMGFLQDLKKIVQDVPDDRQTLMFSATMPDEIRKLSNDWLRKPVTIQAAAVASTPEKIEQSVAFVDKPKKPDALVRYLRSVATGRTLVFCRTKRGCERVVGYLRRAKINAVAVHGDKTQAARAEAMRRFSAPRPPVLIATDVAARGLHLPGVEHVFNYDLPEVPETYVHRIGRTARAGAEGVAISLCSREERGLLRQIERLTKVRLTVGKPPEPSMQEIVTDAELEAQPLDSNDSDFREPKHDRRGGKPKHQRGRSDRSSRPQQEERGTARGRSDRQGREDHRSRDNQRGRTGQQGGRRPSYNDNGSGGSRGGRPSYGRPGAKRPNHAEGRPKPYQSQELGGFDQPNEGDERPAKRGKRNQGQGRPAKDARPTSNRRGGANGRPSFRQGEGDSSESRSGKPAARRGKAGRPQRPSSGFGEQSGSRKPARSGAKRPMKRGSTAGGKIERPSHQVKAPFNLDSVVGEMPMESIGNDDSRGGKPGRKKAGSKRPTRGGGRPKSSAASRSRSAQGDAGADGTANSSRPKKKFKVSRASKPAAKGGVKRKSTRHSGKKTRGNAR